MSDSDRGAAIIARAMQRWRLEPDGPLLETRGSRLLPVRHDGEPAMLKVAIDDEERAGGAVMVWWAGDGAARVLEHDDKALLMERLTGDRDLAAMARQGQDDAATRILCAAAARLHRPRSEPPPASIVPLEHWFAALWPGAARYGGLVREAATTAKTLLADRREIAILHGDLHHGNLLAAGERGWLAIDPKGLRGERTFDYVNILRNPDEAFALAPGRFARQAGVIAEAAALDYARLLRWTLAFTGLSATWILDDGDDASADLAFAALAAAELSRIRDGP